ncbi:MAG: glycoside hydrolase family 15 protein, partial [Actinobacteria bacterium]|nr:glycoside hydrolase family 15 protein [Actinomycetota bacterium]
PEEMGGARNWDYRFSWIRDSFLSIHSLASIGLTRESDGFRRFIQRTSAGSAHQLQIMYGVGGERRLTEFTLDFLEGYRGSKPVRIGNGAANQEQLDAYGDLLMLSWEWHQRGHSPDDDYWRFLCDLVEVTCDRWNDPDRGIWEMRGEPRHFVHSKVSCWAAIDRGIALAEESMRQAPLGRWKRTVKKVRDSILENGVDRRRGCFVQSYGSTDLDSSLLLIPSTGFVDYGDQVMVRTVNAIREDLEDDGLLLRYRTQTADDGLGTGREGFFLACTFWLAECLAGQGRLEDARAVFDRVVGTSNDLGLFAEEFEPRSGELLGNFPQGLTHLAHIAAAVRLAGL